MVMAVPSSLRHRKTSLIKPSIIELNESIMKKLRIIFFAIFGLTYIAPLWAKSEISSGQILAKGVYGDRSGFTKCKIGLKRENPIDNKNDLGCLITKSYEFDLIENSRIGIKYVLKGVPEGVVELEFRVKSMESAVEYLTTIKRQSSGGSIKGILGFSFNQSLYMVPGVWSIGIFHKGDLIVATTFRAAPI